MDLIDSSFMSICVPAVFRQAVVQHRSKKQNVDHIVLSNFRPGQAPFSLRALGEGYIWTAAVSHLSERPFWEDPDWFLITSQHRNDTVKVLNDLCLTMGSGCSPVLKLQDLTAAFDPLDHNILLSRLDQCVFHYKVFLWCPFFKKIFVYFHCFAGDAQICPKRQMMEPQSRFAWPSPGYSILDGRKLS